MMGFVFLLMAPPASAHDSGADIDDFMGDKEKFFQLIDETEAPPFNLFDADGLPVGLTDYRDKIVVLNFVYASCPDVCPLHAEKIAEIQGMINSSVMKDMVQFLTVTTDPGKDKVEILQEYGENHGLDSVNWKILTIRDDQPEDTTRKLADLYGQKYTDIGEGMQMHGVVTHIIDRRGRFAAKFHGLRFKSLNMVLYINGLTNKPHGN